MAAYNEDFFEIQEDSVLPPGGIEKIGRLKDKYDYITYFIVLQSVSHIFPPYLSDTYYLSKNQYYQYR